MSRALRTWSKFSRSINGFDVKFRIQEVSSKVFEDLLKVFDEHFIAEEATCKLAGVASNKEARNEFKVFKRNLRDAFPGRFQMDVCCFDDDDVNKLNIVAISIMILMTRNDPIESSVYNSILEKMKTPEIQNLIRLFTYSSFKSKYVEAFNLDRRFNGFEMVVKTDYRGLGIAKEMYKARIATCKEYKVPAMSAWMTTSATQKAAANLGWETIEEYTFEELARRVGVSYNGDPVVAKMMVKRGL